MNLFLEIWLYILSTYITLFHKDKIITDVWFTCEGVVIHIRGVGNQFAKNCYKFLKVKKVNYE